MTTIAAPRRGVRWGVVGWTVALVAATGLGVLLGRWAFTAPGADQVGSPPATVVVAEMTVGRSIPVAVSASWTARPFGVGASSGVLTSVEVADGASVGVGDRLFTVDLRPVVAAVGSVPSFRDLSYGAAGADVAQLQRLLIATGHLQGAADGDFGGETARAVRAWQKALGVKVDGVVRAGDIVYAARLPARVRVADKVAVGDRLAPGSVVLSVLDGTPEFVATILAGSVVDQSVPIEVTFGEEKVSTVVASVRDDQSGYSLWSLTQPDKTPVCGARCAEVPLNPAEAVYRARQVITPEVTGPGVPAAAVWFTAAGEPYLVLPDGSEVPVRILGEGQGGVVVEGVAPGTTVVLPAATPPVGSTPEPAPATTTKGP